MTHDAWKARVLDHAIGALPPREARELEAHLAACPECAAELASLRAAGAAAAALPELPAPEHGEAVLLAAARQAAEARRRRPVLPAWLLGAALGGAGAIAVVLVTLQLTVAPPASRFDERRDALLGRADAPAERQVEAAKVAEAPAMPPLGASPASSSSDAIQAAPAQAAAPSPQASSALPAAPALPEPAAQEVANRDAGPLGETAARPGGTAAGRIGIGEAFSGGATPAPVRSQAGPASRPGSTGVAAAEVTALAPGSRARAAPELAVAEKETVPAKPKAQAAPAPASAAPLASRRAAGAEEADVAADNFGAPALPPRRERLADEKKGLTARAKAEAAPVPAPAAPADRRAARADEGGVLGKAEEPKGALGGGAAPAPAQPLVSEVRADAGCAGEARRVLLRDGGGRLLRRERSGVLGGVAYRAEETYDVTGALAEGRVEAGGRTARADGAGVASGRLSGIVPGLSFAVTAAQAQAEPPRCGP